MARNVLKLPIARVVGSRAYAASAPKAVLDSSGESQGIECSLLPNKILVSSLDLCGGLSRISVVFRTGPRNEVAKNLGATHVIRSMAGFSTQHFTDFLILRSFQQYGTHFSCTGDREMTSFNLTGTRDNIHRVFAFMSSITSCPAFKPWQITRNVPRLKYEISLLSPQTRVMEMLHRAAFRSGLGNSLFISEEEIENHDHDLLYDYYAHGFTSNRAAVVGINLSHKDVTKFAESFTLPSGDPSPGNSKYFGGEIRESKNSCFATVAVATEGVSLKDLKQSLIYGVLQHALGVKPSISWSGSSSPLYKSLAASVGPTVGAQCLNINYSDNGLFGFMLVTYAQNARTAVEEAWKVLKSGQICEADVARGKAQLRMNVLENASRMENLVDDLATQSLVNGAVVPATVLAEAIDKVTTAEVQSAAQKVACGKFSMAAYGNLVEVPYLDELQ